MLFHQLLETLLESHSYRQARVRSNRRRRMTFILKATLYGNTLGSFNCRRKPGPKLGDLRRQRLRARLINAA